MFRMIPLLLTLLMSACSLTPGMDMKADNNMSELELPVMKNGKLVKEKTRIVPITADLIIERENARLQAVNNLPPADINQTAYKIGPHDRLQITVWEHPELNDPGGEKINPELAGKVVDDNGELYYPYVGSIKLAGKTVSEARALLTHELGKVISNAPRNEMAKTTKSTKKNRLNQTFVLKAFRASAPKVTVTRNPRTT